jgi:hypothetical protein
MSVAQIIQISTIILLISLTTFYILTKELTGFKKIHLWLFSSVLLISGWALLIALSIFTSKLLLEKGFLTALALFSLLVIPVISLITFHNATEIKALIKKLMR